MQLKIQQSMFGIDWWNKVTSILKKVFQYSSTRSRPPSRSSTHTTLTKASIGWCATHKRKTKLMETRGYRAMVAARQVTTKTLLEFGGTYYICLPVEPRNGGHPPGRWAGRCLVGTKY